MANMSYCRFNNTRIDLEDCLEALRDGATLSEDEFKKCKWMFKSFIGFLEDEGIIENDGELDERLNDYFETIDVESY